jgi:hypothetical protein
MLETTKLFMVYIYILIQVLTTPDGFNFHNENNNLFFLFSLWYFIGSSDKNIPTPVLTRPNIA